MDSRISFNRSTIIHDENLDSFWYLKQFAIPHKFTEYQKNRVQNRVHYK